MRTFLLACSSFLLIAYALSITSSVPLVQATSVNLLTNPGFENQLVGWSTSQGTATYTADSSSNHSGCCSAKGVEVNTGSLGRLYQDVTSLVSPGYQYKISGWLKTAGVVGCAVFGIDYVASNGASPADGYVDEEGCAFGTTDWTFYQSTPFTLPAMPSDAAAAWFLFDFNSGAGTAWWDDVSLICTSCDQHMIIPQIANSTLQEQQTSLQLPVGGLTYVYGFSTGGGFTSSGFSSGQFTSATDAAGFTVASLAITNSTSNNFSTQSSYYAIAGASISTSSFKESFGENRSMGARSATDSFVVQTAGSLAVIVALGGGEQCQSLTGLVGLHIDASSPTPQGNLAIMIAHTYLDPGAYNVTESTQQCASGQDPTHAADLIGTFVFAPQSQSQGSPPPPPPPIKPPSMLGFWLLMGGGILSVAVVAGTMVYRRRVGRTDLSGSKKIEPMAPKGFPEKPNLSNVLTSCPNCGTPLPEIAVYCGKCRTLLRPVTN